MPSSPVKRCPQCNNPFQPRRKNQDYCSTECRIDHNNGLAKERYANFKKEAPKVTGVHQELRQLRQYVASLTIVLEGVKEIDSDTITYQGQTYHKEESWLDKPMVGITLSQGGAIQIPGNKIIYRSLRSSSIRNCGLYGLAK
ncbi:MAG: hypothetical protein EOO85_10340 [Pedobacter sp.]|nr:MAG: hypothetical protein EOO85_10340 [Pedobacter sp.]